MSLKTFNIKYFQTREHYEADADEWIDEDFYSIEECNIRCKDLMFKRLLYRLEIYNKDDKFNLIKSHTITNFNRQKYYEQRKTKFTNK